ncbi:MAG: acyltransferase [Flavobacteriales bacterium]|nr:acyltransferase [Flavobacteriales bacterium]
MKKIIEKIIRFRNPNFEFDSNVSMGMVLSLVFDKGIGIFRGILKKPFLNELGKLTVFGKSVKIICGPKISIGDYVKIGSYCKLSGLGIEGLSIGDASGIGDHSQIVVSTSLDNLGEGIRIGNNVGIGEFAYLGGAGGLEIGDECIIGQYFSCHPENHNFHDVSKSIRWQGTTRKGIKIGRNCWIGSKVTILDDVTIGDNCVIAAGAVVTKSMPANSVIGGVPAKVLKSIVDPLALKAA